MKLMFYLSCFSNTSKPMMLTCLSNMFFLLLMMGYGKTEFDVVHLKNYTDVFITEIPESSLVINVEPFDFVYHDPSVLYIHSYYFQEFIKQHYFNSSRESRDVVKFVYRTRDIRFDWKMRNVYVAQDNFLEVSDIGGNTRKTLYWQKMTFIQSMAIDANKGYIFWVLAGIFRKIERASMEGDEKSRNAIIDNYIFEPLGLTLDIVNLTVYWSDVYINKIQKCSYYGNERTTLLEVDGVMPGHLTFFHNTLYWIDNKNQTVNGLSLATMQSKFVSALTKELLQKKFYISRLGGKIRSRSSHPYFRMRVFDKQLLREGYNIYNGNNSSIECEQLMLLSPNWPYYACSCDKNYLMAENGKCFNNKVETEVILGTSAGLLMCSNNSYTSLFDTHLISNFDFLEDQNKIIFPKSYSLVVADLWNISSTISKTAIGFYGFVNGLEFDWIGQNVYFLANSLLRSVVFVMSKIEDDKYKDEVLITFNYVLTKAIAIDPAKGLLFVINDHTIIKMAMDGNLKTMEKILDRTNIVYVGFSLNIDVYEEELYWFALGNIDLVQRISYKGDIMRYPFQKQNVIFLYTTSTHYITANNADWRDYWIVWMCNKRFGGDCDMLCEMPILIHQIRTYPENKRNNSGGHPCQINNGNCSEICLLTNQYPYFSCFCGRGFVLLADRRTCDQRPCLKLNGKCSMECIDLEGYKYECACKKGYQLASDNASCIGEMGVTGLTTITGGWKLTSLNLNSNVNIYGYPNVGKVSKLVYDPVKKQLYFVYKTDQYSQISRSNIYGKEIELVTSDPRGIFYICFDWILQILYFRTDIQYVKANLNGTIKRGVLTTEIFGDVIENVKEKVKLDEFIIYDDTCDIFKGFLYAHTYVAHKDVTFETSYQTNYMVSIETAIFEKHLPSNRGSVIRSYQTKSFYSSTTPIDELGDRIYKQELGLHNDSFNSYIVSYNTDGTGVRILKKSSGYFTPAFFGGDLYLLNVSGSFIKVDIASLEETVLYDTKVEQQLGPESFLIFDYWTDGEKNEICSEINTCWGINNTFECLQKDEICDGYSKCYEGQDEQFCRVCNVEDCQITSLKVSCYKYDELQFTSDLKMIEEYVMWSSHPMSKLITLKNILTYDCLVALEMESSNPYNMRFYKILSIYHLHRLRQAILSNLLRYLDHVQNVDFFGSVLLLNVSASGVNIFRRLTKFKLEQSHINHLPALTFQNNSLLKEMILLDNLLLSHLDPKCFKGLSKLEKLTIKGSFLQIIDGETFKDLISLTFLNLSANSINILGNGIFDTLLMLEIIDLTKNDIKLTSNIFRFTTMLQIIYSDTFTLCCIKPESVSEENCTAEKDDISSCSNLIENRVLASFLWIFGLMAFVGNSAVLVYRSFIDKSVFKKSYYIFIYCLAFSDWLMSVYMLIIAYHDALYDGVYVWNDYTWKRSPLCIASGVLSMVSSEASVVFVCLLTIERYLCVKFAFGEVRLSKMVAVIVSIVVCVFATGLAIAPVFFYPQFFSRSGVCIGIALTRSSVAGLEYSTFIFLGFNFILSAIIPYGQYSIFMEVKKSSKRVQSSQSGRNIAVAKKLAVVVITDCLCWLPIGILVILSLANVKTPRDVYAWVIIFILPINAAFNPYIYTLTSIEKSKVKNCFGMKDSRSEHM